MTTYCILNFPIRSSIECQKKGTSGVEQTITKYEKKDQETNQVPKVFVNDMDENAWYVCSKVWELLESYIDERNEFQLNQRIADIQVNFLHFI